ncbi:Mediator of replication checkpoint protein 1 [Colletotrichum tanaceti]|uniref:Mediator of replication checkpoint protein 1 n=1 Tax=Colletotrichum tanaceti TaxID=1306861 RepID=A0A4U6X2R6_9PEZI|nr:Mediator of replication checkpoint protein 1 [Colletotrichum tanaceti]TKW49445.1 Mediator of replication checkpoint protein 1 [Colletotrichum tanaceti]
MFLPEQPAMASEKPASRSPSASPAPEMMGSLKSRIEARLAAIDTSSDDEEPRNTGRKSKTPLVRTRDSDSEEDDVFRPRGRLAAQLQGGTQPAGSDDEPETFLDRIKRRLGSADEEDEDDAEDTTTGDADAQDEDDVPVAPRRLQRKQARETTPTPTQNPEVQSSPGLFVSPDRQSPVKPTEATLADEGSDSDASLPSLTKSARFQALVERKRQERLAREAEDEKKRAERMERQQTTNVHLSDDEDAGNVSDITDDEGGRKLSQAVRPARRAGKKAVEEMQRETQRMARNMQLAHEAKTRKKFTKADFLQRFNYGAPAKPATQTQQASSSSRPTTPVSAHQTDAEMKDPETPPSSPPVAKAASPVRLQEPTAVVQPPIFPHNHEDDDLPSLGDIFEASRRLDKGKCKAVASPPKSPAVETKPKRHFRVKLPALSANRVVIDLDDDDDDLEIAGGKTSKLDAVFRKIPERKANESNSLHALRRLAQVGSPNKERKRKYEKPTMTVGQLQLTLQQRARQQAKMEREKRLEYLRSKGIIVQTAEEREREMQDVEDIVTRARREAEEIMEREREAAKKEKKEKRKNGELDAWDDSDDEEWEASDAEAEGGAAVEVELSGSEDEQADDEDASDAEVEGVALFDNEADDSGSELPEADGETLEDPAADSEDDLNLPTRNIRRSKKTHVISDDDDEGEDEDEDRVEATPRPKTATQRSPTAPSTKSPAVPTSVLRSAKKTFIPGLPVTGAAGLGLTQIFAGTMDDSQAALGTVPSQSPMPDFDSLPDSNLIGFTQEHDSMVFDSQGGDTQRADTQQDSADGVHLHFSQTQVHGFDSLLRDEEPTQLSMDATQDAGPQDYTPLKQRFVEPSSTVETMVLDKDGEVDSVQDSPLVRRGKLRRKIDVAAAALDDKDDDDNEDGRASPEMDEFGFRTTAFNVMQDAVKKQNALKKAQDYNRKKSKAKEMVVEQAEESEDEYAGLGGVDGEDSDDDDASSVKEMIDDEGGMTADDERKLAALYAERERASDEKIVDKLFHDVTTGMLRRKRGADYNLSDSDDGGEARRRMKRRQFQKMQQALFTDERIKKIAEKPGNQAFLRTIEDRGSDEEMDFLDFAPEPMETDSQSQSQSQEQHQQHKQQQQTVPDSQPLAANATNRPPASTRRTKDGRRPANLGEIRESVSSLLEDMNDVIPATDPNSDSEAEDDKEAMRPPTSSSRSNKKNRSPGRNPRRTNPRHQIVDRLTLKRQSSSSTASTTSSTTPAFAVSNTAVSASAGGGFKTPTLLRRATTNSSVLSSQGGIGVGASGAAPAAFSARGGGGGGGGFGDDGKIKKNASKRSGVSALARENERRAAVQENEKRREARKWKGAERRHQAVNGLFGAGKFE